MTLMGKTEKAKITQLHGPFNESWTSEKPQKAKLDILLKQNAKTKAQYLLSRRIASAVFPGLTRASPGSNHTMSIRHPGVGWPPFLSLTKGTVVLRIV